MVYSVTGGGTPWRLLSWAPLLSQEPRDRATPGGDISKKAETAARSALPATRASPRAPVPLPSYQGRRDKGFIHLVKPLGASPTSVGCHGPWRPRLRGSGRRVLPRVLLMPRLPPSLQEELCLGRGPRVPPLLCLCGSPWLAQSPQVGGRGNPLGSSQPPPCWEPTTPRELSLMPF